MILLTLMMKTNNIKFLRHLIRSRAVTNRLFFIRKKPIFFHACTPYYELPSNISTMMYIAS